MFPFPYDTSAAPSLHGSLGVGDEQGVDEAHNVDKGHEGDERDGEREASWGVGGALHGPMIPQSRGICTGLSGPGAGTPCTGVRSGGAP